MHKGMDVYTDPKVHQGIKPTTAKPARDRAPRSERNSCRPLYFRDGRLDLFELARLIARAGTQQQCQTLSWKGKEFRR